MIKKLKYLLFALPVLMFASCNDDGSDIPQVSVKTTIYDYYAVDSDPNTLYVTPDNKLTIGEIRIFSLDGEQAGIGEVTYFLNGQPFYVTAMPPYGVALPSKYLAPGVNTLGIEMSIAVVGYEVTYGYLNYKVVYVEDVESLPGGAVYVPAPAGEETPEAPQPQS